MEELREGVFQEAVEGGSQPLYTLNTTQSLKAPALCTGFGGFFFFLYPLGASQCTKKTEPRVSEGLKSQAVQ